MENNQNNNPELEKAVALFTVSPLEVAILDVVRNNWNPNEQAEELFGKLKSSIRKWGFLHPILVRRKGEEYEIIDGFHRYKAMMALGKDRITVNCINEEVPDLAAKFLTLISNKLHGTHDIIKEAKIYLEAKNSGRVGLFEELPERENEIEAALKFVGEWDVNQFNGVKPPKEEVDYFAVFLSKIINAENVGREYYKKTRSEKLRIMLEKFFELSDKFKEAAKE